MRHRSLARNLFNRRRAPTDTDAVLASRADGTAQGGFTLLELLVVIAVLGVLGGATALAVSGLSDRASDVSCDADAQALRTAQQARAALEGSYGDEAMLVSGGYLLSESQLHDIVLGSDGYELVPVGPCAQQSTTELAEGSRDPARSDAGADGDTGADGDERSAEQGDAGGSTREDETPGDGEDERVDQQLDAVPNDGSHSDATAERREPGADGSRASACASGQIDLNRSDRDTMTKVVHVNRGRALQIIAARPLASLEELVGVGGLDATRVKEIVAEGLACV